ncbi:MAG: DegT/DnrJ/EryC1/StrS family aminotransferase [Bacteroidaceae bacterium]|nr:DegT/DnrJ/EryC1/StrS family aminotransferase [Bacteroidaceae bacterium]
MEFRDLRRQYAMLRNDIDAAMMDVAASGAYINGKPVRILETDLADYVGVKHCVNCANGTDALTIALKVWGIGAGDAVFVPDFTFFASAETVAAEGAVPVFVDVDEQTYNLDADKLDAAITKVENVGRLVPKVVIAVDLFGLPANYNKVCEVARRHNLLVLEDGAQGFGGAINSEGRTRRACSFGDIATTSFFPAKPLGCYGDGGAIFTDNDEWAALAESLKVHGKGSFKYDNVRIGMNSRLDSIQAAILNVKFKAFKEYELDAVNRAAMRYTEFLTPLMNEGMIKALPVVPENFISSWAQYTIQLHTKEARDQSQIRLKEAGIPSMVYYPTGMHEQTAFAGLGYRHGELPVTESLCETVLSLPMHPYITDEEIEAVSKRLADALLQ